MRCAFCGPGAHLRDAAIRVTPLSAARTELAGGASLRPLRYYNPQVHRAAFALPEFARAALADSLTTSAASR